MSEIREIERFHQMLTKWGAPHSYLVTTGPSGRRAGHITFGATETQQLALWQTEFDADVRGFDYTKLINVEGFEACRRLARKWFDRHEYERMRTDDA